MVSEKWFEWDTEKPSEEPSSPESPPPSTPETIPPPNEAPLEVSQEASESSDSPGVNLPTRKVAVPAQRPFTLWIEGDFTEEDRDRLKELFDREQFEIREVDLELQWESGRILLPQISEYAAMRVAQTLRESALEIRMQANTALSGESSHVSSKNPSPTALATPRTPQSHPAELIPITPLDSLDPSDPQSSWETVDTLLVTGLLKEPEWKAEQTDAFSRLVESLKRELRYRAHIKKAEGLIRFKAEVLSSPWPSGSECRVQVSALAVRKSTGESSRDSELPQ